MNKIATIIFGLTCMVVVFSLHSLTSNISQAAAGSNNTTAAEMQNTLYFPSNVEKSIENCAVATNLVSTNFINTNWWIDADAYPNLFTTAYVVIPDVWCVAISNYKDTSLVNVLVTGQIEDEYLRMQFVRDLQEFVYQYSMDHIEMRSTRKEFHLN